MIPATDNNDRERTILNEALENDYILFLSMMLLMNVVRFNKPKRNQTEGSFLNRAKFKLFIRALIDFSNPENWSYLF